MFGWVIRGAEEAATTDLATLFEYADNFDDSKFVGAILHVSRCGSTALANAFKAVPMTLVLSEPHLFSRLVRHEEWGGAPVNEDDRKTLVKGFLGAVLKEYPSSNIVVKCTSASTITLEQTLRYMPSVRWCFLSRNPADVIASLEKEPGMWLRTQPIRERILLQIGGASLHTSDAERSRNLYALLLERFLLDAMKYASADTTFLDYADFSLDTVCAIISTFLGRSLDKSAVDAIAASLELYSKAVGPRPFVQESSLPAATDYPSLAVIPLPQFH